jgi:pyruvate formate lyase activating enzyme
MIFKGIQKTTLIDFPDKVAAIFFTGGCNFRCPFCYNKELVLNPEKTKSLPEKDIFEFLDKRKKYLDGIVITGGEPTIHQGLPDFMKKAKKMGFEIKLDTNGTNPEMLKSALEKKLVDYVAMDIKSALEKERYEKATGTQIDIKQIKKSINTIMHGGISYEFRTTVVPDFVSLQDIEKIAESLKGAEKYFLQQFVPNENCIDAEMQKKHPYSKETLEEFKKILEKKIKNVEIRGF